MLNMRMLEKCINACIVNKCKYFAIINKVVKNEKEIRTFAIYESESLDDDFIIGLKILYDEETLNCNIQEGMKIAGFTFGDSFEEIEKDLV